MANYEGAYYLGLDVGTDSVGYAVTDEAYHVLDFKGRAMWGVRLFDAAETAEARRVQRSNRRRLQRRRWRIELLQELFAEEICKVDPGFYQRLKDSTLWREDKREQQIYSLFHDKCYTDADFYQDYPTIYHLRKVLLTSRGPFDVRMVYLALHHLMKNRGHFLFSGSVEHVTSFGTTFEACRQCLSDELGLEWECLSEQELAHVLKDKKMSKRDKCAKAMTLLQCDRTDRQSKAAISLLCGLTAKLTDLFDDTSLEEAEKPSISFAGESYEELRAAIEPALQERRIVIDMLKTVYDWTVLADILQGGEYDGCAYLSMAKVETYEKHKSDLEILKKIFKDGDLAEYRSFFQKPGSDNYCAYIGATTQNGKKKNIKKCKYEDLSKRIRKFLDKYYTTSQDEAVLYVRRELDAETFLPLQVTVNNCVIPYQVNKMEVEKILKNAGEYLPFLNEVDQNGISVKEKIVQIFEFRVPYYVGPLNTHNNKNAWAVRKEFGEIKPWNIREKIDFDQSGACFIRRMTNKCTYLIGKDVLPKNSLLYAEFTVWNEINNLKVRTEKIDVTLKQTLFETLFMKKKAVKRRDILNFLKSEGMEVEADEIAGIDTAIRSGLTAYHDFKKIFGEQVKEYKIRQMIEQIILWITIYGDEGKMLKRIIRQNYTQEEICDEQLKKIIRLRYQGWGRLSREFLCELEGADAETGETYTIIDALRKTNDNLTQLLSQKYTFQNAIAEENYQNKKEVDALTYENLMEGIAASPAVKRAAWQSVLIAKEIKKIMGREPEKIFIEMARGEGEKKRTVSRKNQLLELYQQIQKEEGQQWVEELNSRDEKDFRSIKLYLYYTQMGKCMYTGELIDLSQLTDATVYNRDHIYPQSKTKDDSLDNLVLVKSEINLRKGKDILPVEIQDKMKSFWDLLRSRHLISDRKYERLMRKTSLTDEELAGFINRQIVETSQSTKIVANVLQNVFDDSEIVYVKARTVSEFRQEQLAMVKVRSLNDYHHAKDAYLNIVVGNVYHEKFTNNPLRWLKESENRNYNLNHMYYHDLKKNGRIYWLKGKEGSLGTVLNQMRKGQIQYTRYAITNKSGQNGGFFDQNMVGKDQNPGVPMKKGMDVRKYGGYKTITPAYFALVESEGKKGERIRSIEAVPLYLKQRFESGMDSFAEYCEQEYGLKKVKVILERIKKDACLVVDRFPMHLRGTTGKQLLMQGGVQLSMDEAFEVYCKKIEKYLQRNKDLTVKKGYLEISNQDGLTKDENLKLYQELCRKQRETIYRYRPNNQYEKLIEKQKTFEALSCEEQCMVLNEILWLFRCKPNLANLSMIGGAAKTGKIALNKVISNYESVILKNQSVTGLFEQSIDLLKI